MLAVQHYTPYRGSILTREQLSRLSALRPSIAFRDTVLNWTIIIAAWCSVAIYTTWWVAILAIVVVGVRYYALAIIGHDGLHRRLCESRRMNDLWNDLLIMGPICAITRINRVNHIEHHCVTCLPHDPDRHKYVHDKKEQTFSFLFFLSGLQSFGTALSNIFLKDNGSRARARNGHTRNSPSDAYSARDLTIVLAWQCALIGGLSFGIGWWAYPVLWLLPVYLFAYRADLVRVFCEHSMQMSDVAADQRKRLVTYTSNVVERLFFAPHNMNYHAAHHLWPSIPYYNLPDADRRINEWRAHHQDDDFVRRQSYLGYIVSYWLWQRGRRGLVSTVRS